MQFLGVIWAYKPTNIFGGVHPEGSTNQNEGLVSINPNIPSFNPRHFSGFHEKPKSKNLVGGFHKSKMDSLGMEVPSFLEFPHKFVESQNQGCIMYTFLIFIVYHFFGGRGTWRVQVWLIVSGDGRQMLFGKLGTTPHSVITTGWGPPDISWFINPYRSP